MSDSGAVEAFIVRDTAALEVSPKGQLLYAEGHNTAIYDIQGVQSVRERESVCVCESVCVSVSVCE
jgi:hypothetical protein